MDMTQNVAFWLCSSAPYSVITTCTPHCTPSALYNIDALPVVAQALAGPCSFESSLGLHLCFIIEHKSKAQRTIRGEDYRANPTTQRHVPMRKATSAKRRTAQATAQTLRSQIADPLDWATMSQRVTKCRHLTLQKHLQACICACLPMCSNAIIRNLSLVVHDYTSSIVLSLVKESKMALPFGAGLSCAAFLTPQA
jgi:hypothetical protein